MAEQRTPHGMTDRRKLRGGELILFILVRMITNIGYRIIYPFLPVFSRGFGIDLKTMSTAVSLRSLSGVLGPFIAPLTDRRGRFLGIGLGMGLFTLGGLVVYFGRGLTAFAAGLILITLGKYVLDPAVLAYLGDRTPYERRGFTLAVTELSWSLAFILGVPAAGFLIARHGWRAPFLPLIGLGAAALLVMGIIMGRKGSISGTAAVIAPGSAASVVANARPTGANPFSDFRSVFSSSAAVAALSMIAFVGISNEIMNVTFGAWLEDSFGLKIAALGIASAVIGISEFAGESLVAATADRLGKVNAVGIGLLVNTVAAVLLPLAGKTTAAAVACLALFYMGFEYLVVSTVPIMSEILPGARATLLAFFAAAISVGRAFGALLAPRLYTAGFAAAALAAAAFNIAALYFLLRLRRRPFSSS